jgi:SAM-dependent methyltransferase
VTAEQPRVLDFGCGCGRVARHLLAEDLSLFGVDWNAAAVRWCRRHLPSGRFVVGGLRPPLRLSSALTFDLIYAFSVFTHLPLEAQTAWLEHLAGRLAPTGVIVLSTHGRAFADQLSATERRLFDRDLPVVRQEIAAGTNVCAAYHSARSFERRLPPSLTVSGHVPEGARGNPPQDLWYLRRADAQGVASATPPAT